MNDVVQAPPESEAFLRAVTELAHRRPVVTSRAIYNENGLKLLEGGVTVDSGLYDRLVSHRLKSPLDECLSSEPSVNGKLLRAGVERQFDQWAFFAQMGPPGRVRSMILEAIQAIALPRPVAFQLTLMQQGRPELFEHSLQCALLCAHLVREGGAPSHDIQSAATAGLLHDLGMLHIDPGLLAPGSRLEGEQRRPLYVHPLTSSMLVGRFHAYPREIARAVLEHHERLDGSGYPRGLSAAAISPLGRVLSLAEVVSAMFDGQRRYPEQRVSLLLRMNRHRYDPALVPSIHRLLRNLPPPAEASAVLIDEVLHRLHLQTDLLAQWQERVEPLLDEAGPQAAQVLRSLDEQLQSLRLVLFNAGATREQLANLGEEDRRDPQVRIELWTLEQEVQWHLRASANQLQRRLQAAAAALPPALGDWLEQVRAIDQGG